MNTLSLVLLMWACDEPVPLPPATWKQPTTSGQMVRSGTIEGYLVRPASSEPHEALLVRIDKLNDVARTAARTHNGVTVLLVTVDTDVDAATSYLKGLDRVRQVRTVCASTSCQ